MKKQFTSYRPMTSEPEMDVEVSIEYGTFHDTTEECYRVSYFSSYWCRDVVEDFDEEPTDEQIAALIKKSEHADEVWAC